MTAPRATLVVQFGESADSTAFVTAEFDDVLNVDSAGEVKSSWLPGDSIFFLVQHDPSLRIDAILPTGNSGTIVDCGIVSRSRDQELSWPDINTEQELSHNSTFFPTLTWYGSPGYGLKLNGRTLTIAGGAPCTCDAVIPIEARLFQYIPPQLVLATEDDIYRIIIYIYMEAA
jgi:hypothetical protein